MPEKTDEEIAARVQGGDIESFGLLMERYRPKMARYARKFLFAGNDAEDVVQEVFIKAYVNIKSFNPGRRFSPWLYRIAHNEFINALRKKSRTPVFSFDFDILLPHPQAPETADGEAKKQELKIALERCLDKLDAKYREPLVLHYFEEMDYKEVAEILEIPISTVGVRLGRGRSLLEKLAKENGVNL